MNSINFSQMTKDYDPTMYRDSISQKLFELLEEYTQDILANHDCSF